MSPAGQAACLGGSLAPFVTEAQASEITTALWNTREHANVTKNRQLYAGVDTGSELLGAQYALDSLICHCSKFYWTKGPRLLRSSTIFLPAQQHYPLFFMAEVLAAPAGASPPASGATAYIIITRHDPAEPWKIAMTVFDDGYAAPNQAIPPPAIGQNGYELMPVSPSASAARTWPRLLAAYYTHLKVYGTPPANSPFLAGPLTTGTGLTDRRQGYTSSDGVHAHYAFAVGTPGEPWVLDWGNAITACADVLEYVTQSWVRPNAVFEQFVGTEGNWGADLNTGSYSKIVTTWEWPVCISKFPTGLSVGGLTSGGFPIHTGGVPATPRPGTTRVA
jgi:hypothetical protein